MKNIEDYTFKYADELVENALSYWRNCQNEGIFKWSRGTTYRSSNTPTSGKASEDTNSEDSIWVSCNGVYYKAIDCSTLVGLSLQDYNWENSPYYSEENFIKYRKNRQKKRNGSMWGIDWPGRSAAQIGEFFFKKGWIVPIDKIGSLKDNFRGLKKGDILFWAKKNKDGSYKKGNRFMNISHVGIVQGISKKTGKLNVIESTHPTSKKHRVGSKEFDAGCVVRSLEGASYEQIVLVGRVVL